jgi:hypothetical protein
MSFDSLIYLILEVLSRPYWEIIKFFPVLSPARGV